MTQTTKDRIKELIEKYDREENRRQSEADVRASYIDLLFLALGWNIYNNIGEDNRYQREKYIRGEGFVDIGIELNGEPVLFIEAKKFGVIPTLAERKAKGVDRTWEEKQAFRYARGKEIPWAILTNFERFYVFNANEERLILAFDNPHEYLERFNDLLLLSKEKIKTKSLEWKQREVHKEEIDLDFLNRLNNWRLLLAQDIYKHNKDKEVLQTGRKFDFDKSKQAVQRILDRLIIIRFADDREALRTHDILESALVDYKKKGDYASEDHFIQQFINLSKMVNKWHNTSIFEPGHICEKVFVSNETMARIFEEMGHISFRKFTSDILGATYESYLGHRLALKEGKLVLEEKAEVRKGGGIYYTPTYVVRYIVDNTLGKHLKGKNIEDIKDLRVLDPACGSGSFLIYAFEVLADFYEKENDRITKERLKISKKYGKAQFDIFEMKEKLAHLPEPVIDYPKKILKDHLYGVDLDPAAAEIATVNLIMKAFERMKGEKLPLILNQNIKVGNSLISGVEDKSKLKRHKAEIEKLITLREELKATENDEKKKDLKEKIDTITKQINSELNQSLTKYFDSPEEKRPFNWDVESPEVFEKEGFDIVIGNPPYVRQEEIKEYKSCFEKEFANVYAGTADLYVYFFERSMQLLKNRGYFGFIVSNKFVRSGYGRNLRRYIQENFKIINFVDKFERKVFTDAAVNPCIITLQKEKPQKNHQIVCNYKQKVTQKSLSEDGWNFASNKVYDLKKKIEGKGKKLKGLEGVKIYFGIKSGLSKAFIIDEAKKNELIKQDPKSKEIIKPMIRGRDIERYKICWKNLYLIVAKIGIDFKKYPAIYQYLESFKDQLQKRTDYKPDLMKWYHLRPCVYYEEFGKPKIIYPDISETGGFYWDEEGYFLNNTAYMITGDIQEYWLAILNSKLMSWYYKQIASGLGEKGVRYFAQFMEQLPIPEFNQTERNHLANLAQKMLSLNKGKDETEKLFAQFLNNYSPRFRSLSPAYYRHPEYSQYLDKNVLIDSNIEGTVTGIKIDEKNNSLVFQLKLDDKWQDVLQLTIKDENFRLFLFYSIRKFLKEHGRRKKWGKGKIVDILLESIQVPVFINPRTDLHNVERNFKHINLVMEELKAKSPILHFSKAEEEIQKTDNKINELVYKLYGITDEEQKIIE